jgi:cysteine-rich repeat protein
VNTPNDNNCPDDGLFCTGQEICDPVDGCVNTGDPCGPDESCNEEMDTCGVLDLDIAGFWASRQSKLPRARPIRIRLTVKNPGSINDGETGAAAVVGVQNGVVVFSETQAVYDPVGAGPTRFYFGPYTPTAAGYIMWTASIADGNPDADTATTMTRVSGRRGGHEPVAPCGNGSLEPGEECDDGNTLDGDCCSAICQYEAAGSLCADGQFCNGEETCDGAGACQAGTPVDCGDGVWCTIDACDEVADSCVNTLKLCGPDATCNEEMHTCGVLDLDIAAFWATGQVKLSRSTPIEVHLVVKNRSTINAGEARPATVVGVQNGEVVFSETKTVYDPVGNGPTSFYFGPYTPTATGDIIWTATIADGNPDDDTATAMTRVSSTSKPGSRFLRSRQQNRWWH